MGESWEACATREVHEETNIAVTDVKYGHALNNPNMGNDPNKHYVTIMMTAVVREDSPPLHNNEPHKCESWNWMDWEELVAIHRSGGGVLFDPLASLIEECGGQFPF